ncbi:unnamed protein product [marine sediment metagenome]|uniref:Hydrogenase maturation factor HypA n=1 Tax=marine sediment metagenome TaxID=412755 RepID=X0U3B8_9ZZZZ
MHEFAMCEGLVDAVLGEMKKLDSRPRRLTKARVVVGVLRNVVPDYLSSAYEILTKGTAAEGSDLEVIPKGLKIKCKECDWQGEMQKPVFLCDKCGAANVEISGGVDLYLESLEVEEDE